MKSINLALCTIMVIACACSESKLSRGKASSLIQEHYGYPYTYEYEVACGDPAVAKRFLDAGLEAEGWVTIRKNISFSDTTPYIRFTEKAEPLLLPTPDARNRYKQQLVKMYVVNFDELTGLSESADRKTAMATYRVRKSDISPFAKAYPNMADQPNKDRRAYFRKFDDGWRVDKTAELQFLMK